MGALRYKRGLQNYHAESDHMRVSVASITTISLFARIVPIVPITVQPSVSLQRLLRSTDSVIAPVASPGLLSGNFCRIAQMLPHGTDVAPLLIF
jgi:hypothetical protein